MTFIKVLLSSVLLFLPTTIPLLSPPEPQVDQKNTGKWVKARYGCWIAQNSWSSNAGYYGLWFIDRCVGWLVGLATGVGRLALTLVTSC